jgi:hypothetical protein
MTADIERIRSRLRDLPDEELVNEYLMGPDGYRHESTWHAVEEEFKGRGAAVEQIRARIESDKTTQSTVQTQQASFGLRVGAMLLDLLAIWLLGVTLIGFLGDEIGALAFVLIALAYHPLAESAFAATLGKRILRLRLVASNGSRPSAQAILIRTVTRPLIGGLLWFAFIDTPWVHDAASKTVVVRVLTE